MKFKRCFLQFLNFLGFLPFFPLPGHPPSSLLACSGLSIPFVYSLYIKGLQLLPAHWLTQNILFVWFLSNPELQIEGLKILTSFSPVQVSAMSSWPTELALSSWRAHWYIKLWFKKQTHQLSPHPILTLFNYFYTTCFSHLSHKSGLHFLKFNIWALFLFRNYLLLLYWVKYLMPVPDTLPFYLESWYHYPTLLNYINP